jgi:hypothetical protein
LQSTIKERRKGGGREKGRILGKEGQDKIIGKLKR